MSILSYATVQHESVQAMQNPLHSHLFLFMPSQFSMHDIKSKRSAMCFAMHAHARMYHSLPHHTMQAESMKHPHSPPSALPT